MHSWFVLLFYHLVLQSWNQSYCSGSLVTLKVINKDFMYSPIVFSCDLIWFVIERDLCTLLIHSLCFEAMIYSHIVLSHPGYGPALQDLFCFSPKMYCLLIKSEKWPQRADRDKLSFFNLVSHTPWSKHKVVRWAWLCQQARNWHLRVLGQTVYSSFLRACFSLICPWYAPHTNTC